MLCPGGGQLKQKAISMPNTPIRASASCAGSLRGHTTPSLLLLSTAEVICNGRLCCPQPPALKARAGRKPFLVTCASALITSRHRHTGDIQDSFCTMEAGVAQGLLLLHCPTKDRYRQYCVQEKGIEVSYHSGWDCLAKRVQVLVYGGKHAVCRMNALFISCVSCWKYQSG